MGVPPFAGFFGKFYVFMAAVEQELYALAVIGVVTSVIAGYYYPRKALLETLGIAVISCTLLLCLLRYWRLRDRFTLGCVWLAFAFCSREIHYPGSDALLYLSLLALGYLVVTRYPFFKPYIQNRICFSIFAAAFLAYFFSQTVDQRWWRALPYEKLVQTKLEETMEIVGHLYLGAALLLWRATNRSDRPGRTGADRVEHRQPGEETA